MGGAAVIITVFNKEKYLRDTIESVLTQNTSLPFCIILSDDCSTDSSRNICSEYACRYSSASSKGSAESTFPAIKVYDITDGKHRGVVKNFLHCLKFALSLNVQYISQIDSDDILADPDFIARQTAFLDSNPQAQAACSGFFLIGEKDTLATSRQKLLHSGKKSYRNLKITPELLLTKNNPLVAGGVTYRTEHLKEYLETFASEQDATQDLPLWLFLSTKGSFWGSGIRSIAYRNLSESVSRSENIEIQLKFQQASLNTRLRFIEMNHPGKLAEQAKLLYKKKMLRHYAKLSPKEYPEKMWQAVKSNPYLIFSRDFWLSLGIYFKNR